MLRVIEDELLIITTTRVLEYDAVSNYKMWRLQCIAIS